MGDFRVECSQASARRQARARSTNRSIGYARGTLDRAGYWLAIAAKAARRQNARQAFDYVAHAEVDATFVCATDAPIRKDRAGVVFTMATEIPTTFHIAVVVEHR